uniref:WH2 domain-containing protein n=1 Tax=Syphacia muris TaxID=451379 RepID=A0A0N5AA45_9BILA
MSGKFKTAGADQLSKAGPLAPKARIIALDHSADSSLTPATAKYGQGIPGLNRRSKPAPLASKARIIPLDHSPDSSLTPENAKYRQAVPIVHVKLCNFES